MKGGEGGGGGGGEDGGMSQFLRYGIIILGEQTKDYNETTSQASEGDDR